MKYPEKMLLKLPEGTLARIEAVTDNRSGFVRDAIEVALRVERQFSPVSAGKRLINSAKEAREQIRQVEKDRRECEKSAVLRALPQDAITLLSLIKKKPISARDAEKSLGWMSGRLQKAEMALINGRHVRYQNGLMVADDE